MQSIPDVWKWIIGSGIIAVLSFIMGGGWPWKAFSRMRELDLVELMKPHFWPRVEQGAFERHNDLKHQHTDEMMEVIRDLQRSIQSLMGSVERHTISIEFFGSQIRDLQADVEEIKDAKRGA